MNTCSKATWIVGMNPPFLRQRTQRWLASTPKEISEQVAGRGGELGVRETQLGGKFISANPSCTSAEWPPPSLWVSAAQLRQMAALSAEKEASRLGSWRTDRAAGHPTRPQNGDVEAAPTARKHGPAP